MEILEEPVKTKESYWLIVEDTRMIAENIQELTHEHFSNISLEVPMNKGELLQAIQNKNFDGLLIDDQLTYFFTQPFELNGIEIRNGLDIIQYLFQNSNKTPVSIVLYSKNNIEKKRIKDRLKENAKNVRFSNKVFSLDHEENLSFLQDIYAPLLPYHKYVDSKGLHLIHKTAQNNLFDLIFHSKEVGRLTGKTGQFNYKIHSTIEFNSSEILPDKEDSNFRIHYSPIDKSIELIEIIHNKFSSSSYYLASPSEIKNSITELEANNIQFWQKELIHFLIIDNIIIWLLNDTKEFEKNTITLTKEDASDFFYRLREHKLIIAIKLFKKYYHELKEENLISDELSFWCSNSNGAPKLPEIVDIMDCEVIDKIEEEEDTKLVVTKNSWMDKYDPPVTVEYSKDFLEAYGILNKGTCFEYITYQNEFDVPDSELFPIQKYKFWTKNLNDG